MEHTNRTRREGAARLLVSLTTQTKPDLNLKWMASKPPRALLPSTVSLSQSPNRWRCSTMGGGDGHQSPPDHQANDALACSHSTAGISLAAVNTDTTLPRCGDPDPATHIWFDGKLTPECQEAVLCVTVPRFVPGNG